MTSEEAYSAHLRKLMKRKPVKLTITQEDVDDLGAVLNCAVRYCLGRRTYMPSLVTTFIGRYFRDSLSGKTIDVMKRDIDEAKEHDALGDPCDVKAWNLFREWLDTVKAWDGGDNGAAD